MEVIQDLTHIRFQGAPPAHQRSADGPPRTASALTCDSTPAADGALGAWPAFVLAQSGLDPAVYRAAPLERRVSASLRSVRAETELRAMGRVASNPELLPAALDSFLIGVSDFFRDPPVFDLLRAHVIPALAAMPQPLNVLSVGCSSGAELCSVAILLAEAGQLERARLLGIDCRAGAVAAARLGCFPDETVARLDPAVLARYFHRTTAGWRVAGALRTKLQWQTADATRGIPEGPWQLVLCRNLVIYLQAPAAHALFGAIRRQLAPGGFLVVGKAERPPVGLALGPIGRSVYRSREDA